MVFGGLQKLTLLDFPGVVACTLFTKGCNFRCPFCHNASLVSRTQEAGSYTEEEMLAFLKKRQGLLEGVCITGGEPLLQEGLTDFIRAARALGYKIKLDTNGSFPKKLKQLVAEGLLDYVAMDIKNSSEKYHITAGCDAINIQDIEESIDFLLSGAVPYEFRTTVAKELHTIQDIGLIAKRIAGAEKYFIQNFADSGDIIGANLSPLDDVTLGAIREEAAKHTKFCKTR